MSESSPSREDLDNSSGIILIEFGSDFCGYCQAAENLILQALSENPKVKHIKIEDGSGKKLGRSFRVKLWPTLILLKEGKEISRVVRPESLDSIRKLISKVDNLEK